MYMSKPAIFIDPIRPNWRACLIRLVVSLPALASPRTWAPDACACRRKVEKSVVCGKG